MSETDQIINALIDARDKGKLAVVSAVTTIDTERLSEIINGGEMTTYEETILEMHLEARP
jgi:hypothetical protein